MREVTKRQVLGSLVAGGAFSLAGCMADDEGLEDEGENETSDIPSNVDSSLVTKNRIGREDASNTISYWATAGHSNQNIQSEETSQAYNEIYEQWAEENEDYKIEYEVIVDHNQHEDQLLTAVNAGNQPDTSAVDSFWLANVMDDLQPLDDHADSTDDYLPFVEEAAFDDEGMKGAWFTTDCRLLFYRQDFIDQYADGEAPETWDELIEIGSTISDEEGVPGYMYNGSRWEATCFDNLAFFWGQGGDIVEEIGSDTPVFHEGDNYDYLVNTFEFIQETVESGASPQRVVNVDDYNMLSEEAMNGEVGMFLGGQWQYADLQEGLSEEEFNNWSLAAIPMPEASMSATGTGGWTVGSFSDDPGALSWAGHYTKPDVIAAICEAGGYLPTRQSIYEDYDYFQDSEVHQISEEAVAAGGRARPGGSLYQSFSSAWQVAVGQVATGDREPQQAVDEMVESVVG